MMCNLGISFCFHHLLLFCRGEGIPLLEERDVCARGKDCRCGESPPGILIEENEQEDGG